MLNMLTNNLYNHEKEKKIRKIGQHQKKIDIDTQTKTTELKTQLYKMTDLRNNSWLPMVCLRNNSCDLT